MTSHNPNLYRWDRLTKPRTHSRSQRVATTDDIQDWIKKVEAASDRAAEAAFGTAGSGSRQRGRQAAQATVENLHMHDAAYNEAQDLLQQWVNEKVILDDDLQFDEEEDDWVPKPCKSDIKREWDHLLEDNDVDLVDLESDRSRQSRKSKLESLYSDIDNVDEGQVVDDILQGMLDKEFVQKDFLNDLGLDNSSKRYKDPRTKMQLRHQQVKENREKRMQYLEKRRREQQAKKEAQFKAKQIIMKEERNKAVRLKQEEAELQKEMSHIRKQMHEERRRADEMKARERREKEELEQRAQEEYARQQEEELRMRLEQQQATEQRRREVLAKLGQLQTRKAADNLKLLQRHFSAWYNVVVERRLQMGQARAMADWKCLLRAWNAWKSYSRGKKLQLETIQHELLVKESHRKQQQAEQHFRQHLLQKYFMAWQLFVQQQTGQRELENLHGHTRSKISAFLEAAASGALWPQGREKEDIKGDNDPGGGGMRDSARERVDDLFAEPSQRKEGWTSERSDLSTPSSGRSSRVSQATNRRKQAWQFSRKDVSKMTIEDIANFSQSGGGDTHRTDLSGGGDTQRTNQSGNSEADQSSTKRSNVTNKPWEKKFIPNNFEHRHQAQQKILETQQKQIKEQQRLIEEMQFFQKQQLYAQQVTQHNTVQQMGGDVRITQLKNDLSAGKDTEKTSNGVAMEMNSNDINNATSRPGTEAQLTARSEVSGMSAISQSSANTHTSAISASTQGSIASKHSKFTKKMEERAAERARLKAEREEKRRKAELERLATLQAEEEERQRKEAEEKKARLAAYREKKHVEKLKEQEKLQQIEHLQHQMALAEQHYDRAVMKFRGWIPFRKLVDMARGKWALAENHDRLSLTGACLWGWHSYVKKLNEERCNMAQEMQNYLLTRRCFANWRKIGQQAQIQEEKAERFFQNNLKQKVFLAWMEFTNEEKFIMWENERRAREFNSMRTLRLIFRTWRRFPQIIREEEMKEKRKEELRKKVASILPDFGGLSTTKGNSDSD